MPTVEELQSKLDDLAEEHAALQDELFALSAERSTSLRAIEVLNSEVMALKIVIGDAFAGVLSKPAALLHRIEKRIRFKWHRAPIATEKIPTGCFVGLHRGFWGQLYARPAEQPDKMLVGVAIKAIAEDQPYPTWEVMTHGTISAPVSNFTPSVWTTKEEGD